MKNPLQRFSLSQTATKDLNLQTDFSFISLFFHGHYCRDHYLIFAVPARYSDHHPVLLFFALVQVAAFVVFPPVVVAALPVAVFVAALPVVVFLAVVAFEAFLPVAACPAVADVAENYSAGHYYCFGLACYHLACYYPACCFPETCYRFAGDRHLHLC